MVEPANPKSATPNGRTGKTAHANAAALKKPARVGKPPQLANPDAAAPTKRARGAQTKLAKAKAAAKPAKPGTTTAGKAQAGASKPTKAPAGATKLAKAQAGAAKLEKKGATTPTKAGAAKLAKVQAGAAKLEKKGATTPTKAGAVKLAKAQAGAAKLEKTGATKLANATASAKASGAVASETARADKASKLAPRSAIAAKPRSVRAAQDVTAKLPADDLPMLSFDTAADWKRWLDRQHKSARGLWLKLARKGSGIASVERAEAVDGALCYGWIDGQGRSFDEHYYLIKFTPRGARSIWSKLNRVKVQTLIEQGLMQPAGLAEVERAQRDGRWEAAYDSPRTAAVPEDLAAALAAHPRARSSFAELNSANRYAILWQLQTAKKAETRARRISRSIEMLERGETLH